MNKTADVFVDMGVSCFIKCCVYVGISVFKDLRNIFNNTAESPTLPFSLYQRKLKNSNEEKKIRIKTIN